MAYTTIKKPSDYFNTKLWSGNGSSQALTGVGHQTDMVWIKSRTDTRKHNLYDVVRGVQKRIVPNDTPAEDTVPGVTAFGTDGFTVGSETDTNGSSRNFVGWSWNANGAGSANTDGSISSTVSANTTSGFSIVTVSKPNTNVATIGHGLGVVPAMIIGKNLASGFRWIVYQKTIGNTKAQYLNENFANTTSTTFWNDTSPTSSVFTIGSDNSWNGTSVFYCFAEKQGYSKFGSYTGNGSTDGTFVYTGFKPAFVMVKNITVADGWQLIDAKRNITNGYNNARLQPNSNGAEDVNNTWTLVDLLSNGFKQRYTDNIMNASGKTYIYMAFAEQPLVGDNPATAR